MTEKTEKGTGGAPGRRITILGMGQTAVERRVDMARWVRGTEVWSLNNGYGRYPVRPARWFELHRWDYLKQWSEKGSGSPAYFHDLNRLGCPVYTIEKLPVIRNQVQYPIIEIVRHFDTNYFLGSPSLMVMLALYEHDLGQRVAEIRSYGIDTQDDQHRQQRSSWAWWLRAALDRKIALTGTATNFMLEPERDLGLDGLRDQVGAQVEAERIAALRAKLPKARVIVFALNPDSAPIITETFITAGMTYVSPARGLGTVEDAGEFLTTTAGRAPWFTVAGMAPGSEGEGVARALAGATGAPTIGEVSVVVFFKISSGAGAPAEGDRAKDVIRQSAAISSLAGALPRVILIDESGDPAAEQRRLREAIGIDVDLSAICGR